MRIYRKTNDKEVQIPKDEQVKKYKFSWMELVTNHKTGETSATGFCGMVLVIVPLCLYTILIGWYFFNMSHFPEVSEILDKLQVLIMIGGGLLGLRKAISPITEKIVKHTHATTVPDIVETNQEEEEE